MVLGVARRVLRDGHAADDAFQCVFLVLARKAGALRQPDSLAPWLHGTAYRTALRARTDAARRRVHERQAPTEQWAADPAEDVAWQDLRPVLDEEIDHLPARYRVPVVLCYLQGLTNAEAAEALGCSRGTIATRLARARERLRVRLRRRGIALGIAAGFPDFTAHTGSVAVPTGLYQLTLQTALRNAVGTIMTKDGLPATVAVLTQGVLRAMLLSKLKTISALLLVAGVLGLGASALTHSAEPAQATGESGGSSDQEVRNKPTSATPMPLAPVPPPAAPLPPLLYQIGLRVVEKRGKAEKVANTPVLLVMHGQTCSFGDGHEQVLNLPGQNESLWTGITCKIVVSHFDDKLDEATLNLTAEYFPAATRLPHHRGFITNSVCAHALQRVRVGEAARVQLHPQDEPDRTLIVTAKIQEVLETFTIQRKRAHSTQASPTKARGPAAASKE
jgi:RNA polymerase sigma factor (sigma-70 family)